MGWIPSEVSMYRSTASQQCPLAAAQQNAAPEGQGNPTKELEEEVEKLSQNEGKSVKISSSLTCTDLFQGIQFLLFIIRKHVTD